MGQKSESCWKLKKAQMNKRRKVLNRDEGNLFKRSTWTPHFVKLPKKETNAKT